MSNNTCESRLMSSMFIFLQIFVFSQLCTSISCCRYCNAWYRHKNNTCSRGPSRETPMQSLLNWTNINHIQTMRTFCRVRSMRTTSIHLPCLQGAHQRKNQHILDIVNGYMKQNGESTGEYLKWKVKKGRQARKTGLNNWSTSKSQKGAERDVRKGYRFPAGMPHPLQMVHGNHSQIGKGQARYNDHKNGEKSER